MCETSKDRPYDYKADVLVPGYHFNRNGWDRTTSSWIKSNESAAKNSKIWAPYISTAIKMVKYS